MLERAYMLTPEDWAGRDLVAELRRYAERPGTVRRVWEFERRDVNRHDPVLGLLYGPALFVGVGPGVGVLLWAGYDELFMGMGGANTEPVDYLSDEWTDSRFPAGAEHPLEVVLDVAGRFLVDGGRPEWVGVEWTVGVTRSMVFRETGQVIARGDGPSDV